MRQTKSLHCSPHQQLVVVVSIAATVGCSAPSCGPTSRAANLIPLSLPPLFLFFPADQSLTSELTVFLKSCAVRSTGPMGKRRPEGFEISHPFSESQKPSLTLFRVTAMGPRTRRDTRRQRHHRRDSRGGAQMFLPTHQPKHLTYGKTFDLAAITVVPWAGAVSSLCDRHVLSFDPSKAFDLAAGFTLGSRLYPGLALSPLSEIAAPLRPRFDLRLFGDKLSHFVFRRPHSPRDGATWRGRGAIPTVTPGCTFQGTSLYFRRWARSN